MLAKHTIFLVCSVVLGLASMPAQAANAPADPAAGQLRVGVYDSRSVALAFGRSKAANSAVENLVAEAKAAETAGDGQRLEAIKKKGSALQNLRHMQVFGNAPIHDMLPHLKAALEEQAQLNNLDLIVRDIDIAFEGESVVIVDITKGLVDSCQPTKDTLNVIEQMKHHPPLPLEQFPIEHEQGEESKPTSNPAAEADALSAAKQWLQLIDTSKYEDSWKQSSAHFQAVVPSGRWLAEMQHLRSPLGDLVSREVISHVYRTELPDAPVGEYVVIQFKTEFENRKNIIETVTPVREADGTWKVDGYYIR